MFAIKSIADFMIENRWIICQSVFAVYVVILAVMDIKWRKLPINILFSGVPIAVLGAFFGQHSSLYLVTAGGCVGLFFLLISRGTREAFGYGDSILITIMGIFVGFWNILYLLMGAFTMAAVFSAVMMFRHRFNRKSSFPFVPFLAAAYIGGILIGM